MTAGLLARGIALPLIAVAMGAAACGSPASHARPEFVNGRTFRTVALLPPEISIDRSKLSGGESLVAEALRIEDTVSAAVVRHLQQKGYVVQPGLSAATLDERPDLRDAVADLHRRHDDLLAVIARDPEGIRRGRFTLGADVAAVGEAAGADLLLVVHGSGVLVATSQKVAEAVVGVLLGVGGLSQDTLSMLVTVVDGRDGRIMAIVSGGSTGNVVKEPERVVGKAVADAFRAFPPQGGRPPK
jgi:hypothetical protein